MRDKAKGAGNLVWLASRQSGRADPSLLAADDILGALTGRIAELEARVSEILAEVDPELRPVDSKQGSALSPPKPDASRGAAKIFDARVEADAELARASEERRMLATEMRLLREAFQEARRGQLSAGPEAKAAGAQLAPDVRAAIADEMRSLLTELLADFRSRVLAPPPVERLPAEPTVQVVAAAPPIVDEVVEHLKTAPPVVDEIATAGPPIETTDSLVEHVDELIRPAPKGIVRDHVEDVRLTPPLGNTVATAPIETSESIVEHVDELVRPIGDPIVDDIEDLRKPEPSAPADVFRIEAAPIGPAPAIVEENVPEFLQTESSAPPESASPLVDEPVFGPAEPVAPMIDEYVEELRRPETTGPIETFESSAALSEPIVDQYIENLRLPAPPPLETFEMSAAPAEPIEPIVEEYVEELPRSEFTEPIADQYVAPPSDLTITPSALPPVPDPRLAALWDAAPLPTEAEAAPLSGPEPASFITEDFIAETRAVEIPEAPLPNPAQELAPHQTIEYAPPVEFAAPPAELAPPPGASAPPSVAFAPEPPPIVEPEREAWVEPRISEPAPASPPAFPELRVADERGLHEIQVVISPIHSFPRLLETEHRIRALSTVSALHLRDFRNGVATLTVSVAEAISPAEFGAVIQMLESLHLRLEGTSQSGVELRAEESPTD